MRARLRAAVFLAPADVFVVALAAVFFLAAVFGFRVTFFVAFLGAAFESAVGGAPTSRLLNESSRTSRRERSTDISSRARRRGPTRSIEAYRAAVAVSPNSPAIHWRLAFAHTYNGQPDVALERLELESHLPYKLHGTALALYDLGDLEGAEAAMSELLALEADGSGGTTWDFGFARAYAWMGDVDNALKYLRLEDAETRDLYGLTTNPYFVRIRDDQRWQELAARIDEEASQVRFEPRLPPELLATP